MARTLHQGVVNLLRDDPDLGFELVRSVFGIDLPDLGRAIDRKGELDRFTPCFGDTGELRPDLALSAECSDQDDHRGGCAMIVEVQKDPNVIKRWRIWVYWALLAERLRRTTIVLVIPLTEAAARWARRLGRGELHVREGVLVLDRQTMPKISNVDEARRRPARAVLSAVLHWDDVEIARTALAAVLELGDDRRWRYVTTILSATPEHERDNLMGVLSMQERYELTPQERNSILFHDGVREGIREGRREGRREGLVDLILAILELRQISLDEQTITRVRTCEDLPQLQQWAERAKRADDLAGVF